MSEGELLKPIPFQTSRFSEDTTREGSQIITRIIEDWKTYYSHEFEKAQKLNLEPLDLQQRLEERFRKTLIDFCKNNPETAEEVLSDFQQICQTIFSPSPSINPPEGWRLKDVNVPESLKEAFQKPPSINPPEEWITGSET